MKRVLELWQTLNDRERKIATYLVCMNRPVSIDTLTALSGESAVFILSLMDMLKKRRAVREEKGRKGIYSVCGEWEGQPASTLLTDAEVAEALKNIVTYYRGKDDASEENDAVLADLHRRLGTIGEGAAHILKTANALYRAGRKDEARHWLDEVINYFEHHEPRSQSDAKIFLETVLGEIFVMQYFTSSSRMLRLLQQAHRYAKNFRQTKELAHIKLAFALEYQAVRQHAKAKRYLNQFLRLAEELASPDLYRDTAFLMCEFYQWDGRHGEVIRYYESTVGNVDEFGDDDRSLMAAVLIGYCFSIGGRIARGMGMISTARAKAAATGLADIVAFADIMGTLCLLEIRKFAEAEEYLNRAASVPESKLNHMVLRGIHECKAYILTAREQYDQAFRCHEKGAEQAKASGRMHHPGAFILEYLGTLESNGFVHKQVNYRSEMKRLLNWNDAYMKGVALRHRALRSIEAGQPSSQITADLKDSEKHLQASGAQIELARTRAALWSYYRKKGRPDIADGYRRKAVSFLSTLDKSLFPDDLRAFMAEEKKVEFMAERIVAVNQSLGSIRDRSLFFDKVLNAAMEFSLATRAAFLLVESGNLSIYASRNFDASLLPPEKVPTIISTLTDAAISNREIVIPTTDNGNEGLNAELARVGVASLLGLPAHLYNNKKGYLVLENRLDGGPFPADVLPFLRILCSQISVGSANINIYEEVNRLKERYEDQAAFYKKEMDTITSGEMIVGPSEAMKAIIDQIGQVGFTDSAVLILGETGVGKELVARAIHNASGRKDGPFIPVNLASLPQELVASELFGHEKGAFTGAHELRKGRFELADAGTIFLDEIGDLPLSVQVKLLRVLQEGVFERLGGSKTIRSDFRVIAATHKNLSRDAEKGLFRQDLYWRLNVFPIYVPPLRERREDIPVLAKHFLESFTRRMGKSIGSISPDELKKLMIYHWPGNVRELKHFIERAVILSDGHGIRFSGFDPVSENPMHEGEVRRLTLAEVERDHIEKVLAAVRWQVSGAKGAASILGLKPTTLLFRMKKLGIRKPDIPAL